MRHIGFTGSRCGMSPDQRRRVDQEVCDLIGGNVELRVVAHHGDCIGSDYSFHAIARQYGCAVCIHPPMLIRLTPKPPVASMVHADPVNAQSRN